MNWPLWKRWIGQGSVLLAVCAAGMFAFCWLRVWVISQIEMGSLEVILKQVWEKYERFSPVPLAQRLTYHGRVALAFEEPLVVLGIAIWAISRGSNAVSGHISSGVLEMLLAQPVSRQAVIVSQSIVTLVGLVLLSATLWLGMAAGIHTTKVTEHSRPSVRIPILAREVPLLFMPEQERTVYLSERTSAQHFLYPTLNLFSLGVFLAGLTTLVSACDRHRWRTIGIVVGFVVVQMAMRILSDTAPALHWMAYGTILSAFEPQVVVSVAVNTPQQLWSLAQYDPAGNLVALGPLGYYLLFLVPGVLSFVVGTIIFCRRDLPAPL
jgi:ABC-2 type transport system permease protein